jgi:hypothetical protein
MRLRIYNRRDFWSGMMFTGFGGMFAVLSRQYDMGTLAQMGPGWFPFVLGLLLVLLGLLVAVGASQSAASSGDIDPIGWRELGLVVLAIALFALLLPYLGVVVSIVLMVVTAALAAHERRAIEVGIVAVALSLLCYVIFIRGLGVPLPVWPVFFGD